MKLFNLVALAALAAVIATPALAEHGGKHGKGHMFERADTNKDGAISQAEFRAKGDAMFGKLDANKDGKITKAESDAARERWKQKRLEKRDGKASSTEVKSDLNN